MDTAQECITYWKFDLPKPMKGPELKQMSRTSDDTSSPGLQTKDERNRVNG